MEKIYKKKLLVVLAVVLLISLAIFSWQKYQESKNSGWPKLTLEEASKIGDPQIYQLLVQINENPDPEGGGYERGDIIQVADADKQWSVAEQEGFLIIRMNLTPEQAEAITQAKEKKIKRKKDSMEPGVEQVEKRLYYLDLADLGIGPEDQAGRVIDDRSIDWQIVKGKE